MRWLASLMAAVMALPVAAPAAGLSGASDPSIVIGFVTTRSGAGAIAGLDAVDGFSLALKQLGGRFSNQEVRVLALDDKGSADTARKQVARLIQSERLDMVVASVSVPALAAMTKPLAATRVFVLNLETPPLALARGECGPNMFTLAPPGEAPHQILGHHLVTEGARHVVVISPENALADQAIEAFKAAFPFDVTVLRARRGATTFERELKRIGEIRPDAVYTLLNGGTGTAFIRSYDAGGGKELAPLYATADAVARPLLPAMGDAALEVRAIANWTADIDNPGNKRFVGDFETEFGRPATERAARGYDAALLLDAAIKANNGKTHDGDALRSAFRRAEFSSLRGTFHFAHNHQPVMSYYLVKVGRDQRGRLSHETLAQVARDWREPHTNACAMHWPEEYVPPTPKPTRKN